jgi:hypothetical protein
MKIKRFKHTLSLSFSCSCIITHIYPVLDLCLSLLLFNRFWNMFLSSFRMFNNEDVTIGSWMLAMNVNHENTHALCEPDCTDSSIAVWDIPKCSGYYLSQLLEFCRVSICEIWISI